MSFITKVDYSRQLKQPVNSTAHFSGANTFEGVFKTTNNHYLTGSTAQTRYLFVCGEPSVTSANTETGLLVSMGMGSFTGATNTIVSINQPPLLASTGGTSGSSLQIKSTTLIASTGTDLEIDTKGNVVRNTSSRRYKTNIRNLDINNLEKLLRLNPRVFNYKSSGIEDIGYIAEEVAELGLTDFILYDERGRVDSVKYKLLAIAVIEYLKKYTNNSLYSETPKTKVEEKIKVIRENYTTENTRYIITKDNPITITLDNTKSNRFYIKSMTNTILIPKIGLIDENWDELQMGPQSSVEVLFSENNWYVLSSDGLKDS